MFDLRQQVSEWIAPLTAAELRLLAQCFHDVLLPDGRPLWGIKIGPDCYLGRDRQFWGPDDDGKLECLTLEDVIQRTTIRDILHGYLAAKAAAQKHSPKRYHEIYGGR